MGDFRKPGLHILRMIFCRAQLFQPAIHEVQRSLVGVFQRRTGKAMSLTWVEMALACVVLHLAQSSKLLRIHDGDNWILLPMQN